MALDSNGLTIRTFDEILAQLEVDEKANIHPDLDTRDDEYIGQMNNIISLLVQELEQTVQAAIDNLDPALAEGLWLEKLAAEKSVARLIATSSNTEAQSFTALDGTVIPSGTVLTSTVTGDNYQTTSEVTVSATSCLNAVLEVSSVVDTTDYDVTVNGTLYSYTSDGTATALEIVNGIKSLIDADVDKTWTATVDTGTPSLTIATSDTVNINVSFVALFSFTSVTRLAYVEAVETGSKVGVINTVTIISSTVGGLLSTYNTLDMNLGRDLETDEELRLRMYAATNIKSVAVVSAILSRVRDIEGVSLASVTENTTAATVGSLPPHSYELVVIGGDDDDIASELWLTKPAGIATYGTTNVNVTDTEGVQQTLNFTRPTVYNVAFRVTYTTYSEETLSTDIDDIIKAALIADTAALTLGEDILPQRFFGNIFNNSEGLATLVVEVQQLTNSGDTPNGGSWVTTALSVTDTEYASTANVDITIL